MNRSAIAAALVRFRLQAKSRVALRAMTPVVAGGAVAAAVVYGSPVAVIGIFTG